MLLTESCTYPLKFDQFTKTKKKCISLLECNLDDLNIWTASRGGEPFKVTSDTITNKIKDQARLQKIRYYHVAHIWKDTD